MSEKDPSMELAFEIFELLKDKGHLEANVVLSGVAVVLSTIAVEMGMEEEKAVYAFTKTFRSAKSRLKALLKKVH